jgi:CysZ protein
MLRAFLLSVGQLGDPPIIAVFLKSLAITVLLLAGLGAALWFAAGWLAASMGLGDGTGALVETAAVLAAIGVAWLLFRVVAIGVMDVFADEVVVAVERKHYPEALAEAQDVTLGRSIAMGLGSAGRALLVNLAVSPLYLLLFFTGVGLPLLFFIVNGWLLGHDLGQMVAARHIPRSAMKGWRGSTAFQRFTLGLAGTAMFLVPILNIFAPVIGAAMATHLFHGRRRV